VLLLIFGIGIGVILGVGGLFVWALSSPSDPDKPPKTDGLDGLGGYTRAREAIEREYEWRARVLDELIESGRIAGRHPPGDCGLDRR
jgi:hypothetical protein